VLETAAIVTKKRLRKLTELEIEVEKYKMSQPRDKDGKLISQNEVARRLSMNEARFSNILRGKVKNPRHDFFEKLSALTGVPYYRLLSMADTRLKADLDALLAGMTEDEKRERLDYARAFESLPPAARARIQDKLKGK